jgi:putative membrane protein
LVQDQEGIIMKNIVAVAVAALAISAAPALAASSSKHGKKATTDQSFEKDAALGGMEEVELGNLAKQKASNSDVKQFGDRMVTDHSKANDQLKQVAKEKNIPLPTSLDAKHQAVVDRLSKLSGDSFDKAYMREMLTDHKKDVAAFRRESASGKDSDVKQFASNTLSTLEQHRKLAEDTASKVGVSATAGTSGHASTKSKKGSGL